MLLHGHHVLIVESENASFIAALQTAVERAGAHVLIARDLEAASLRHSEVSVALVNAEHRAIIGTLDVPLLLYWAYRRW